MKLFLCAVVMSVILSSHAKANPIQAFTGTTMMPVATSALMGECVKDAGPLACLWPFMSTSTTSLLVALKEDINQVEQDAHNALAGEPVTDALASLLQLVRGGSPELESLSDDELIRVILEVVQN